MTTPAERLALIQKNYDDASDNETSDLARATTPAQVAAIQANVASARAAYYSAVAAALTQSNAAVEDAYQKAQDAQTAVQNARGGAAAIADLIGRLGDATDKANSLLKMAQSV